MHNSHISILTQLQKQAIFRFDELGNQLFLNEPEVIFKVLNERIKGAITPSLTPSPEYNTLYDEFVFLKEFNLQEKKKIKNLIKKVLKESSQEIVSQLSQNQLCIETTDSGIIQFYLAFKLLEQKTSYNISKSAQDKIKKNMLKVAVYLYLEDDSMAASRTLQKMLQASGIEEIPFESTGVEDVFGKKLRDICGY